MSLTQASSETSSSTSSLSSTEDEKKIYLVCYYTVDRQDAQSIQIDNNNPNWFSSSKLIVKNGRYTGYSIEVVKRKAAKGLFKKIHTEYINQNNLLPQRSNARRKLLTYDEIVKAYNAQDNLDLTEISFYFFIRGQNYKPLLLRKFFAKAKLVLNKDDDNLRINKFSLGDYTLDLECVEDKQFKNNRINYLARKKSSVVGSRLFESVRRNKRNLQRLNSFNSSTLLGN